MITRGKWGGEFETDKAVLIGKFGISQSIGLVVKSDFDSVGVNIWVGDFDTEGIVRIGKGDRWGGRIGGRSGASSGGADGGLIESNSLLGGVARKIGGFNQKSVDAVNKKRIERGEGETVKAVVASVDNTGVASKMTDAINDDFNSIDINARRGIGNFKLNVSGGRYVGLTVLGGDESNDWGGGIGQAGTRSEGVKTVLNRS